MEVGRYSVIPYHDNWTCGDNVTIGSHCVIDDDVVIGGNVKIGHGVFLKKGTIVGNDVVIGSKCITTGACYIGNHVNIRPGAIISQATILEDFVFIGPGVITNHTKHVNHGREDKMHLVQLLTHIGYGAIIGSGTMLLAGVTVAPLIIVGAGSVIVDSIYKEGIFVGNPVKWRSPLPSKYQMEVKRDGFLEKEADIIVHIKNYLPNLRM